MSHVPDIEKIWLEVNNKLFTFISNKVQNKDDVRDIIQDTFVKVKLNIDKLLNPAKAENWIFQIARNTMYDYFRDKGKSIKKENVFERISEDEENEDDILIQQQTESFSDYTGFVVSQLPEKYKKAVYMADIEGKKMHEIADELDLSISGAKSRVQRARRMIKDIILQCCDVTSDNYGNIIEYKSRICRESDDC